MKRIEVCRHGTPPSVGSRQYVAGRFARYRVAARAGLAMLGVVVAIRPCLAQASGDDWKLNVHFQNLKMGAKNPKAGDYPINAADGFVTVPPQCVGAKRCPLFIQLPGGGQSAEHMTDWLRPVANKYGLLLLTLTDYESVIVSESLTEVLQHFAVDSTKIGIVGRCASGGAATRFGIENLNVFSRIASISGGVPIDGMDPNNKTAEFFVDAGFRETGGNKFAAVEALRSMGHPVKQMMGLRGHEDQVEDYDFLGRWLAESWAKPDPAAWTPPAVVADPLPELTTDAMAKMNAFWTAYLHEPDSTLWTESRQEHLREVVVPIGEKRPVVVMTDMAAMAAKYPAIAADLKKAGLTAQQHDAYRIALIAAQVTPQAEGSIGTLDPTSTMAKNVAFYHAHQDLFEALETAGVDDPSRVPGEMVWRDTPDVVKSFGPMGIWRSP